MENLIGFDHPASINTFNDDNDMIENYGESVIGDNDDNDDDDSADNDADEDEDDEDDDGKGASQKKNTGFFGSFSHTGGEGSPKSQNFCDLTK